MHRFGIGPSRIQASAKIDTVYIQFLFECFTCLGELFLIGFTLQQRPVMIIPIIVIVVIHPIASHDAPHLHVRIYIHHSVYIRHWHTPFDIIHRLACRACCTMRSRRSHPLNRPISSSFHLTIIRMTKHRIRPTKIANHITIQPPFLIHNLSSLIDDQIQHSKSPRCVANPNNPYPFNDCVPAPCPCVCAMMDTRQHIQPDTDQRDHTLKNEENDKEMI